MPLDEPQAISPDSPAKEVVLYQTDDGNVNVSVMYYDESFWLTQKAMSELFGTTKQSISYHLNNIFSENELDKNSVVKDFLTTASDGKNYKTLYYNLDAIIAVGYRINSYQATKFRQWATATLKEYMIKGFVLNDDMLKNGSKFGKDYFDELLERIKEIRASERRFYQKITDIYAQCSYDYDPKSETTRTFFKTVQNKLLFAITGHTAPEIIHDRADSTKDHMGMQTWKNAPDGKILKSDVTVSKNYLSKEEISGLNDIVNMYLDYAENQAKRNKLMSMNDWITKLDSFLQFNEYDLMENLGIISREVANSLAIEEYEKYRVIQDDNYVSDFDKATKKYLK
ncbi:virulence RhuM family protein [Roseburia hominis]|uniref:virulence RhuM family protein n=1 Tax=Roseburia hominis TaxID=301301 RepID=UPI003A7F3431